MEEQIEIEETPKRKRSLIIIGAITLLIILLPAFLTTPTSRNTLSGLLESSTLDNLRIRNTDIPVYITQEVNQKLLKFYNQNVGLEFKACLKGYIENNSYFINDIYQPKHFSQTVNQVIAEPCNSEDLISLHSHPRPHCLPSQQDLQNHEKMKKLNPDILLAVMCTENRLNIYN